MRIETCSSYNLWRTNSNHFKNLNNKLTSGVEEGTRLVSNSNFSKHCFDHFKNNKNQRVHVRVSACIQFKIK